MKYFLTALCWASSLTFVSAQDAPKVLSAYLTLNQTVKGEIVAVVPPEEIKPYIQKVEAASIKNPEWFTKHSATSKPGIPLPYDERLGLTKEEYAEYLALWDKRDFKVIQPISLRLEKFAEQWMIRVSGAGSKISLLRYDPKTDQFASPNGQMERLEDIQADAASILRSWTGHEWRFQEESTLGKTKENFAIGRTGDQKFGLMIYRLQDITASGRPLYDQSVLIRFPLN